MPTPIPLGEGDLLLFLTLGPARTARVLAKNAYAAPVKFHEWPEFTPDHNEVDAVAMAGKAYADSLPRESKAWEDNPEEPTADREAYGVKKSDGRGVLKPLADGGVPAIIGEDKPPVGVPGFGKPIGFGTFEAPMPREVAPAVDPMPRPAGVAVAPMLRESAPPEVIPEPPKVIPEPPEPLQPSWLERNQLPVAGGVGLLGLLGGAAYARHRDKKKREEELAAAMGKEAAPRRGLLDLFGLADKYPQTAAGARRHAGRLFDRYDTPHTYPPLAHGLPPVTGVTNHASYARQAAAGVADAAKTHPRTAAGVGAAATGLGVLAGRGGGTLPRVPPSDTPAVNVTPLGGEIGGPPAPVAGPLLPADEAPKSPSGGESWLSRYAPLMAGAGALGLGGAYLHNRRKKKKDQANQDTEADDEAADLFGKQAAPDKKKRRSPLVPLGLAAAAGGAAAIPAAKAINYNPAAMAAMRDASGRVAAAPDANEALTQYVTHGGAPLKAPAYGDTTGHGFLRGVKEMGLPIPGLKGYDRWDARHYSQFEQGPANALNVLAEEDRWGRSPMTVEAIIKAHGGAAAQGGNYHQNFVDNLIPSPVAKDPVDSVVDSLKDVVKLRSSEPTRIPGWEEGRFGVHDAMNSQARATAARLAPLLEGAAGRDDVIKRLNLGADPSVDRSMGFKAKAEAAMLLPKDQQEQAVRQALTGPGGDVASLTLASQFPVTPNIKKYESGSSILSAPVRATDWAGRNSKYLIGGGLGLAGLGAIVARRRRRNAEKQSAAKSAEDDPLKAFSPRLAGMRDSGRQAWSNISAPPGDTGAQIGTGIKSTLFGGGGDGGGTNWGRWALYGGLGGAGLGLLGGMLGGKKKKRNVFGDVLTGGLLGAVGGGLAGGISSMWGGVEKAKAPAVGIGGANLSPRDDPQGEGNVINRVAGTGAGLALAGANQLNPLGGASANQVRTGKVINQAGRNFDRAADIGNAFGRPRFGQTLKPFVDQTNAAIAKADTADASLEGGDEAARALADAKSQLMTRYRSEAGDPDLFGGSAAAGGFDRFARRGFGADVAERAQKDYAAHVAGMNEDVEQGLLPGSGLVGEMGAGRDVMGGRTSRFGVASRDAGELAGATALGAGGYYGGKRLLTGTNLDVRDAGRYASKVDEASKLLATGGDPKAVAAQIEARGLVHPSVAANTPEFGTRLHELHVRSGGAHSQADLLKALKSNNFTTPEGQAARRALTDMIKNETNAAPSATGFFDRRYNPNAGLAKIPDVPKSPLSAFRPKTWLGGSLNVPRAGPIPATIPAMLAGGVAARHSGLGGRPDATVIEKYLMDDRPNSTNLIENLTKDSPATVESKFLAGPRTPLTPEDAASFLRSRGKDDAFISKYLAEKYGPQYAGVKGW